MGIWRLAGMLVAIVVIGWRAGRIDGAMRADEPARWVIETLAGWPTELLNVSRCSDRSRD